MQGIHLHHNHVHHTGGEGFYVGHTFYNGQEVGGETLFPHLIEDLVIEHNHVHDTDAEGIQVGSTISGLIVRFNVVERSGQDPFMAYQSNGMQIGMSSGLVYGNRISDSPSNGLIVLSQGDVQIVGNVIARSGTNGMFVDDRFASAASIAAGGAGPGPGFVIAHNTIVDSGQVATDHNQAGIRLYATDLPTTILRNNLVVGGPGPDWAVTLLNASVPLDEAGTLHQEQAIGFVDPASDDYRLRAGSAARDAGVPLGGLGPWGDADGYPRPYGVAPDVGAYEFGSGARQVHLVGPAETAWVQITAGGSVPPATGLGGFSGLSAGLDHAFRPAPVESQ